jgi:amino acid transporter
MDEPDSPPQRPRDTKEPVELSARLRRVILGKPRDLADRSLFHRLALVPLLAWVGLGADGLSSSSYGPQEAFLTLGTHTYLLLPLAALTALTVTVIAAAYSHIIEEFPSGGGGYLVATKLLGPRTGVLSGSALLVDYVLTIAVSIAAAGDALFSFMPAAWHGGKLPVEVILVFALTTLNLRGVRESVLALLPIFIVFLVTHVVLIVGAIALHLGHLPAVAASVAEGYRGGVATLGVGGLMLLLAHAYSMGGGTYTGIEAVSNGLPILREPRVANGKRTMVYMATSLAFAAGGLLIGYLLLEVSPIAGKTMNAALLERFVGGGAVAVAFVVVTLISEGALLVVAAQTGFIGGPQTLANMAVDSWVPRRFAALSERLTTQNGIFLMGASALAILLYARGSVGHLVVMYSINVFLTFSLSMFGMLRLWLREKARPARARRLALFTLGFLLCVTILVITTVEKFREGGWITLLVTGSLVVLCFLTRRHYSSVGGKLGQLDAILGELPVPEHAVAPTIDPRKPTAVVLVGGYGGLGIHTLLNVFRAFPHHFANFVFVSVGVVDSGAFKGASELEALERRTAGELQRYVDLVERLGHAGTFRMHLGTDAVAEVESLCVELAREFSHVVFFAGKIIFQKDHWWDPLLHNQTAYAVQKRLQWQGIPMVIMPVRVR